ncbi:hypothetical protein CSE45_1741 [Citreicella sp. SE45]|nr:hypothetical protein CSE45_1741 [Citreicella sp. SE45]
MSLVSCRGPPAPAPVHQFCPISRTALAPQEAGKPTAPASPHGIRRAL